MSDNKKTKKSSNSSKRSPSIIIGIVLIIMTICAGVMIHRYETKHGRSGNQTKSEKSDDKYSDAEDASIDTDKSEKTDKSVINDDYMQRATVVYKALRKHGITRNGAIAIMCAAGGESGMRGDNLEDSMESYMKKSGLVKGVKDDESFTKAVNSGYYKGSKPRVSKEQFIQAGILEGRGKPDVWCQMKNSATGSKLTTWGYGLIQFSSSNRKELYNYAEGYFKGNGKKFDISDLSMQAAFISEKYSGFATVKADLNDKGSRYVIEVLKDESITDFDFLMASVMRCLVAPYNKSYPNAYAFLSTKSGKQHIANHTDKKVGNTGKTVYEANCYVADYVDGN